MKAIKPLKPITPRPLEGVKKAKESGKIDWLNVARVTSLTVVPPVEPSITIDGSWICTKGDSILISGEKKAGKSNVIVNILATAFMQDVDTELTLKIRTAPIPSDKLIIYVDNEQSIAQTKAFIGRVKYIAGLKKDPENLQMFNLRKYSTAQKCDFLNEYLSNLPSNIGLLVLDGVVDFLDSVNNEEMSKNLSDKIFSIMTAEMSVVSVIHQGKTGTGAKGHAGEIFGQKCVGAISLSKNRKEQVHTMKCNLIRTGADFEDIHFEWNTETNQGFKLCHHSRMSDAAKTDYDKKHESIMNCIKIVFKNEEGLEREQFIEGILKHDTSIKKDIQPASRRKAANRNLDHALVSAYVNIKGHKFFSNIKETPSNEN